MKKMLLALALMFAIIGSAQVSHQEVKKAKNKVMDDRAALLRLRLEHPTDTVAIESLGTRLETDSLYWVGIRAIYRDQKTPEFLKKK